MRQKINAFLGLVLACSCFALTPAFGAGTFHISAIPDEAPTKLIRIFEPIASYLSKELGVPVKFTPLVNYAATVEALAAKKVDMVWYGGFTYVQARIRTNGDAVPLVMRDRDAVFKSYFITRAGGGIKSLKDLKGKTFAFGSVSSTSGHLMPRFFLLKEGISPEKDFAKFSFSGAHDATVKWVQEGKVDAGALNEQVWEKMMAGKLVDTKKVTIFYTTPPYHDYNWTVRGGLAPEFRKKIRDAFLKLNYAKPEDRKILDLQGAKKYIPARPGDYDSIEEAARNAKLLK
ncbi:MAG: putative selenate ABC transporter substrate-binding protein [Candidatus Tectomicrobia bacterium]|uniref:Selenate ABC transporter substrate-binding protein n=1 Tax=Tectimicrobiota bacterium TaxID=2528274 RepID=A0A932I147_UNCTE|nr:putative selenate ABC transporter substrate-binding protein [Candidatus Tectomicrobia bacterium]